MDGIIKIFAIMIRYGEVLRQVLNCQHLLVIKIKINWLSFAAEHKLNFTKNIFKCSIPLASVLEATGKDYKEVLGLAAIAFLHKEKNGTNISLLNEP